MMPPVPQLLDLRRICVAPGGGVLLRLIGPKVLIAIGDHVELLGGASCQGRNPDMVFGAW